MKCPSCGADSGNRFCPFCGCEMPKMDERGISFNDYSTGKVVNNYFYSTYEGSNKGMFYDRAWYDRPLFQEKPRNAYEYCSSKSRLVALIICLLFGMFGGHYFYVGRSGMGILYLLTGGVGGLGWIYDLCRITAGNFFDVDGEYLRR